MKPGREGTMGGRSTSSRPLVLSRSNPKETIFITITRKEPGRRGGRAGEGGRSLLPRPPPGGEGGGAGIEGGLPWLDFISQVLSYKIKSKAWV